MHAAHGIGETIGSGAGGHVVGMEGTAGAAAGSDGEVLLAVLPAPLLVGAGNRMLESGGVGGVTGDGNVHAFLLHDSNAFENVVGAVALDLGAVAVGEGNFADDGELGGGKVEGSLNVGEAVDSGDDIGSVLAQTVQDNAEGLGSDLVGGKSDLNSALSGGEGLVAGEEAEALGLLAEQHCAQVAVAKTDLAVVGDGAGDAESLKADADSFGSVGGGLAFLLDGDSAAHGVSPDGVLKSDGLGALDDLFNVDALFKADVAAGFDAFDAILGKDLVDGVDSSVIVLKQHC